MDQRKTGNNEGFLTRIYKDLFLTNKEKIAIDKNLKTANLLDKNDGIFGVSENNVFNVKTDNNFLRLPKEKTIFDLQNDPKLMKQIEEPKIQKPDSERFNAEFLKNLKFNKSEAAPELGNKLDQAG